mmetsp:Transcript_11230/g.41115  ORF Transcript_11230/g.41115 Transcript_11230/m.41115 type:complete len:538 (-) Transcript_11230:128-1741(-)
MSDRRSAALGGGEARAADAEVGGDQPDPSQVLAGRTVYLFGGGSRGDCQPLVALGHRLRQETGCNLVFFAGAENRKFASSYGFEFREFASMLDYIRDPEVVQAAQQNLGNPMQAWHVLGKRLEESAVHDTSVAYEAVANDDTAIATITTSTHITLGEVISRKLPHICCISLCLQPLCPTVCHPSCLLDVKHLPPPEYAQAWPYPFQRAAQQLRQSLFNGLAQLLPQKTNMASHIGVLKAIELKYASQTERIHEVVGVEMTRSKPEERLQYIIQRFRNELPQSTVIYGYSRHLFATEPTDYPKTVSDNVVGYQFLDRQPDGAEVDEVPATLTQFLSECAAPPIYIGWGSLGYAHRAKMCRLAIETLYRCKRNGVILGGWAEVDEKYMKELLDPVKQKHLLDYAREHVVFVDSVPHQWLLPQCSACVIHGGAGTTAACLRAGVPLVVTPFGFDQPFMAERVQALGVGLRAPHVHKCTARSLSAMLRKVTGSQKMKDAAMALARKIKDEDGTGQATRRVLAAIQSTARLATLAAPGKGGE